MAKDEVRVRSPSAEVDKADVVIRAKTDGHASGALKISQDRVEWMPSGKKKRAYEIGWGRFGDFFPKYGTPVKRGPREDEVELPQAARNKVAT